MAISKMLTISTAHINSNAVEFLNEEQREVLKVVYDKEGYGWFIYLGSKELEDELKKIPESLSNVIKLALKHDCLWLCLDCDGNQLEELPTYEW